MSLTPFILLPNLITVPQSQQRQESSQHEGRTYAVLFPDATCHL